MQSFDWFYLLSTSGLLVVAFALAVSPLGDIVLGDDGDRPEFSTPSWLAMLFAAGMGAGLLFWGAAEPVWHFVSPPPGGEGMNPSEMGRRALVLTNFHWGLHAWAIYGMAGLAIAWFGYRKKLGFLPSAPIRAELPGPLGEVIGWVADVIAVLSVVFGVAGSLGMGVMQIVTGLHVTFGTPADSTLMPALVLGVTTVCFLISASTSLDKGIQILSNLNMAVAIGLMVYVLLAGPTGFLLSTFTTSVGDYLASVVPLSTRLYPFSHGESWSHAWTLTYMVWWIAWTPFTGIFIARISRGRTIRQFLTGVVCVPTVFSLLWFGVFGGTGLYLELFQGGAFGAAVLADVTSSLFILLGSFPGGDLLSIVALFLLTVFLVTSADSASYVLGMLTTEGDPDPSNAKKITWGVLIALLASAGLFSGGGVPTLRALAIVGAVPFGFILVLQVVCLIRSLSEERA